MKRSCLILLGTAATAVTLALPSIARADFSTDGWSWGESATAVSAPGGNLSIDGWSWGDEPE